MIMTNGEPHTHFFSLISDNSINSFACCTHLAVKCILAKKKLLICSFDNYMHVHTRKAFIHSFIEMKKYSTVSTAQKKVLAC